MKKGVRTVFEIELAPYFCSTCWYLHASLALLVLVGVNLHQQWMRQTTWSIHTTPFFMNVKPFFMNVKPFVFLCRIMIMYNRNAHHLEYSKPPSRFDVFERCFHVYAHLWAELPLIIFDERGETRPMFEEVSQHEFWELAAGNETVERTHCALQLRLLLCW